MPAPCPLSHDFRMWRTYHFTRSSPESSPTRAVFNAWNDAAQWRPHNERGGTITSSVPRLRTRTHRSSVQLRSGSHHDDGHPRNLA